ncbi:MAG: hemolysin family protein [Clostridia bacterium]
MDEQSIGLILILIIMVALSAFFSASETAFSSVNQARLKTMANSGDKKAKQALKLVENYDELLSTILVGNNIVNISSATIATILFCEFFVKNGATISTIVMTVVVLIFGEITPKSIAKEAPEKFAMAVVPIYKMLNLILKPVNFLLLKLKTGIKKLVGASSENSALTEDELLTIVDEVQQLNEEESELIKNAIEFNDVDVADIFTPRIDVDAVENTATNKEIANIFKQTGHSRLPVYKENIDSIIGVINEKDFHNIIGGSNKKIDAIIKPAQYVVSSMKVSNLLKLLQRTKSHIAVVVDEYGGTQGIVTMEDILEELVGEIWDEHDEEDGKIKQNEDGSYIIPTSEDLDDLFEMFDISQDIDSATINGWIIENIDKIPTVGDSFDFDNLTITVSSIENRRATEINIKVNFEKVKEEDD